MESSSHPWWEKKMASYRGHLTFSTILGAAYGVGGYWFFSFDPIPVGIAGVLTAASGLLPDLDSDSGVPQRTLFGSASILLPLLAVPRMLAMRTPLEEILVFLVLGHVVIRYGLSRIFKRITVHRGMFHSIPGMLIAGLCVFLIYHHGDSLVRAYVAGGAMLGFLSHLVLDELCSVDISGANVRLNKFAGSALKFASPSWMATACTYIMLAGLAFLAAMQFDGPRETWREWQQAMTASTPRNLR
jgi:LexA-binding, inner membrane-associated putative hydrolase